MNPSRNPALSLKLPVWRSRMLLLVFVMGFGGMMTRAVYLQGMQNDFLQRKGDARSSRVIEISAHRGMIADRNGEPLAISTPVESVWISPEDIEITPQQQEQLAALLELNSAEVKQRLAETEREFVYLKRQLPPEQAAKVVQLHIPGVFLKREYRRYYPAGEVMAHLVGFTDVDDNGQEGMELAYQEVLAGQTGGKRVIKDRLGRIVEDVQSIRTPQDGQDLALSIDSKIQYLAYRELKAAVAEHQARAGGIVVLDATTGEVLALANLPVYNPNNRGKLEARKARNRAVTDLFEPGSTLKPFTVAAALDAGLYKSESLIQTAPGQFTIGSATIHDAHPNGMLTVAEVIQKSSNVGAAKIALSMSPEKMWDMLNRVGFGTSTHSGFPGESPGKLRAYQTWRPIEQATMSYGHGISVSLLQLARAYTVFASDGQLLPVSFLKRDEQAVGARVVSPKTAKVLRDMLELVVQPGGTAPLAQVAGYRVAGKTGTAHKLEGNGYAADRYVASFVGFAPASNPRVVVAVMLDEPSAGEYYGGTVAAPVFSRVTAGALRMLGVSPDAPIRALPLPDAPAVKEEV